MSATIDKVLQDAVDSGAVPGVAAIAADRNGVIYEGAAGPKVAGAAFTNQIGDLDFPAEIPTADPGASFSFHAGPGWKWGYGLLLNTQDMPGMRRAGSGAWAGLMNTHFWVDPTSGIAGSIYSNFLPFVPQEAMEMYGNFEKALYASR